MNSSMENSLGSYLRQATCQDMDILFSWANDITNRKNAFHSESISYEEHIKWFEGKMRSKDTHIYIYNVNTNIVGQVRVDIYDNFGKIDYFIDRAYRGCGNGWRMIRELESRILYDDSRITNLIADVKYENIPSRKVFENLGYTHKDFVGYIEYMKVIC